MSEEEHVDIEFDVNDKVTPKLTRMERQVGRLGSAVDRASARFMGFAGQAAGLGAFFALGPAIAGAKHYIDRIDDMAALTGVATDRLAGMQNTLQGMGVDAGLVDSIFGKMVKRGQRLSEGQKSLVQLTKKYGVEMKDGPEGSILAISKLFEKGKMDAGALQRVLGLSSMEAAKFSGALEQGPEALKAAFDEAQKKNVAFSEEGVRGFAQWQDASDRIGVSWNRMTASILVKLAPGLAKLAGKMESSIDKWADGAAKFGNFLSENMDSIIDKAKTYAKIMLATSLMNKAGISASGLAMGAGRGVSKIGKGIAAGASVFSMGASRGGITVIGQMVAGLFKIKPIISLLMKFGPIGIAMTAALAVFRALSNNVGGITDRLKSLFGTIAGKLVGIGQSIAKLFTGDGPLGKFLDLAGHVFLTAVERVGEALSVILTLVQKIIDAIPELLKSAPNMMQNKADAEEFRSSAMRRIEKANMQGEKRAAAIARVNAHAMAILEGRAKLGIDGVGSAAPGKVEPPKNGPKGPAVYQDFRGSRFDITQAFSDGYDPDRVAVAFSNDIAALGEKKVQSGFSPVFSVR